MYASLWTSKTDRQQLLQLAQRFSPEVEQTSEDTVVFSILPLRKLVGSPHQIASEICRAGHELKLEATLAIAANPDAAVLLARNSIGVTLVTPGEERLKLASVPLTALFEYDPVKLPASLLEILFLWGVKTCEDLLALPEIGLAERLGQAGIYLRRLAAGTVKRPLRLTGGQISYQVEIKLEHSLQLLEPLLFLLSRSLGELCHRLRSQSRAARELKAQFHLDTSLVDEDKTQSNIVQTPYCCRLEFPVPLYDPRTILKLLQLHLERHPTGAPVHAFSLHLEPVEPQHAQGGIFLPATPTPDKLQVTLARIAGMVGPSNVGTPVLLDTHRPDAFLNNLLPGQAGFTAETRGPKPDMLRLALRLFRPALHARVDVAHLAPKNVQASGVKGRVTRHAGPWKTAGEWWAASAWSREEWDVALDDGALYRIYQESSNHEWFVYGIYD